MSWVAHDPEGYTTVCIRGILAKLDRSRGLTQPDRAKDKEILEGLAEELGAYNIFLALCDWARAEITQREADYLQGKFS